MGRMMHRMWFCMMMLTLAEIPAHAGDLKVILTQPFKAGEKEYPPGRYRILADDEGDHIDLENLDRKTGDQIKFNTRLSPKVGDWGEIVFDKIGNDLYLSEVYIVGMDGFYFHGAPGKHKHLVIREKVFD